MRLKTIKYQLVLILICFFATLFAVEPVKRQSFFIENKGQILDQNFQPNNNVLFLFSGNGFKVQLRKTGYSYELFSVNDQPKTKPGQKFENTIDLLKTKIISSRVDIDFGGMNPQCEVVSEEAGNEILNYVINGDKIPGIKSFKKVTYKNVYSNIDIEFILNPSMKNVLKYNVILRPGADIEKIKFLCKGSHVKQTSSGAIEFETNLGSLQEDIPLSYYSGNLLQNINVKQKLDKNSISFSCNYDKTKTLIIDPSTNIIWGTYFGGSSLDNCTSVGKDAAGNVYLAGHTLSTSNIATAGSYQATLTGSYDLYLAKFTPSGSLTWATYYGGANLETAYAIFVESNGTVYVCGDTASPSGVASSGAHQTTYGGGIDDALLAKFDTNGQLQWATYYGGNQHDIAYALTIDGNGNPIISGHTESANTSNCIATAGAYSTIFILSSDVFVAKFNSSGVRQWGTYYGDSGFEETWGIKCDALNNIIITGFSSSLSGLSTPPCHQNFSGGGQDAFIAKFNSSGNTLVWATYFGGTGDEQGTAVEIDNSGIIFISGNTTSSSGISTPGTYQTSIASSDDGFITAFTSSGTQLWGTYFGGGDTDYINDLELDGNMNLLFCGETLSNNGISSVSAYQPNLATINNYDAYFAKFSNNGIKKLATYYGGEANDNAKSLTVVNNSIVYLAGETTSTMGISTPGSYMTTYSTTGDGFLGKFCVAPEPFITPASNATICMNVNYTLTTQAGYPSYFWNAGGNTNSLVLMQPLTPGIYYYTVTSNDIYGCNGTSDSVKITVDNCVTNIHNTNFNKKQFDIYPVPSTNYVAVSFQDSEDYKILEVYSATGQLLLREDSFKSGEKIHIQEWPSGIYYIRLIGSLSSQTQKFLKE